MQPRRLMLIREEFETIVQGGEVERDGVKADLDRLAEEVKNRAGVYEDTMDALGGLKRIVATLFGFNLGGQGDDGHAPVSTDSVVNKVMGASRPRVPWGRRS